MKGSAIRNTIPITPASADAWTSSPRRTRNARWRIAVADTSACPTQRRESPGAFLPDPFPSWPIADFALVAEQGDFTGAGTFQSPIPSRLWDRNVPLPFVPIRWQVQCSLGVAEPVINGGRTFLSAFPKKRVGKPALRSFSVAGVPKHRALSGFLHLQGVFLLRERERLARRALTQRVHAKPSSPHIS